METFLLILLMLAAVLASSVIDQLVPKVSSPLIQIGLGLVITVVAGHQIDLLFDQSELFLVLFIAPLLFHEAKEAKKRNCGATAIPSCRWPSAWCWPSSWALASSCTPSCRPSRLPPRWR
ncbi:MAG: hypothetical protein V8T51_04260 [Senegalimassilia faecalis]